MAGTARATLFTKQWVGELVVGFAERQFPKIFFCYGLGTGLGGIAAVLSFFVKAVRPGPECAPGK
jgi:hypothetical protein